MAKKIPEIPGGTIVLHQTGPNIDSWTEILRATSPRISIIYPDDARLDLDELWRELMNDRIPADSELFDWPNISQILFIVHMDFGGSLRSKPLISIHNITFFCIDDIAFSPKDFKDIPNPNNGPNTDDEDWEVEDYGIHHHYSPKQLSWRRRYQEILARVKSAETRVPVPPSQPKVIPCKNTHNLNGWISYFEELSPRIKIYRGGTSTCSESLKAFLAGVRKYYGIDDPEDQIINWPRDNEVAFTLSLIHL